MKTFDAEEMAVLRTMMTVGNIQGRETFKPELREAFDRLAAGKYITACWGIAPDVEAALPKCNFISGYFSDQMEAGFLADGKK